MLLWLLHCSIGDNYDRDFVWTKEDDKHVFNDYQHLNLADLKGVTILKAYIQES